MDPETAPFEAFYASAVQHPLLLWLAAALALGFVLARSDLTPAVRRFCVGLCALSFADAWLTSSPIALLGELPAWAASGVPLFFVLAGDLRFLLVALLGTPDGDLRLDRGRIRLAAGLTLIVPVSSQLLVAALPEGVAAPRVLFLVYELSFFVLTLVLWRWHPNLRGAPWLRRVAGFVLVYYGLWASADALILFVGADWGYGLRVVPNVLYYGGLIAAIAAFSARAGREARVENRA